MVENRLFMSLSMGLVWELSPSLYIFILGWLIDFSMANTAVRPSHPFFSDIYIIFKKEFGVSEG